MNQDDNINAESEFQDFSFPFSEMRVKNPFAVPENYFETLPGIILSRIEHARELKALSPTLSQIEKKNPFKVPDGYFNNPPDSKENPADRLKESPSSLLSISERKNPFIIPENYFDHLSDAIQNKILLNATSGPLSSIKKEDFKTPENYFENLSGRINQRISENKEAKVISIRDYYNKFKYSAIAVAASIAAIISIYLYYPENNSLNERPQYVSAEDISNSLYFRDIDESTIIAEINDNSPEDISNEEKDMEDYLIDNDIDEITIINEL